MAYDQDMFTSFKMNDAGVDAYVNVTKAFCDLAFIIDENIPENSREKSIVMTKLQEASMFTNRAIALSNKK